MLAKAQEAQAV